MTESSLLQISASDQARLIAARRITATELFDEQLAAIGARDRELNAFVTVAKRGIPAQYPLGSSPLAGTAYGVKDSIDVAGLPSHSGLRALHAQPAQRDAAVVARLNAAGLMCIGKLNMHAMALGATNHNTDFGNCYNPHRYGYTPGGSSGGSGAAVGAGLCGIALGTDTMGSVRIPAAYCGVVGFKPSFEAISTDGVMPLCRALDHVGILARSVEDVIHAFQIVADMPMEWVASMSAPIPARLRNYRFAIPSSLDVLQLDREVSVAFLRALEQLRSCGFQICELDMKSYSFSKVRRAGLLISEAELLTTLATPLANCRNEMPPDLLSMLDYAANKSAADVARALSVIVQAGRWLNHELLPFDGLLLPTTAQTAFPMKGPVPTGQADLTAMANVSGGPAISLPLPVGGVSLPIGLQLIGRRGADITVLQAAKGIEHALH